MKLESQILNNFFDILNKQGINYCVMNNYTEMPEVIPSDVDFAIEEKAFNKLDSLVFDLASKHNVVITQKIWHGYNKCAYILTPLNIEEYFWLQLDFFVDFCAKGYPKLLPIESMLSDKVSYKNFYTPKSSIEVLFVLQRRIFKRDMKIKHLKILYNLYIQDEDMIKEELLNMFGSSLGETLTKVILNKNLTLFNKNLDLLEIKLKHISISNFNFKYYFLQIKRVIYRLMYPTGLSIAFVGNNTFEQEQLIAKIDNVISGSFHGTLKIKPTNLFSYLFVDYITIVWAKITKKKVYITIDLKNWKGVSLWILQNIYFIKPDLVFFNSDQKINKLTHLLLKKQSDRTAKHFFNILSPTSKK